MSKVLIVDDEPDVLLLLRINLEAAGYEAVLAADGEMALERIADSAPDLVLLDIMMPVMDGLGVLRALADRADAPLVVVVSAKSSDRDIVRALTLGAMEYVVKPFDPDDLTRVVERVLRSSKDELEQARAAMIDRCGGP
ncbi:MAG: Response regulator receiver domain protein [Acidimicrobiales bacterium]|nr:Response regulator receiver domain protein [Acidimicrobiales bacterium]